MTDCRRRRQPLPRPRTARALLPCEPWLLPVRAARRRRIGSHAAPGREGFGGWAGITADIHFQIGRKGSSHFRHFLGLPARLLIKTPRRELRALRPAASALGSAPLHGNGPGVASSRHTCTSPPVSSSAKGQAPTSAKTILKGFSRKGLNVLGWLLAPTALTHSN